METSTQPRAALQTVPRGANLLCSNGAFAVCRKIKSLVPRGFGAAAVASDEDFDEVRFAVPSSRDAALQCRAQIITRSDAFAGDSLALRQLYEINVRIAKIHARVFPGIHHPSAVLVVSETHRLVVAVVPNDREDGNVIAGLRPEARSAVHDRTVADGRNHLAIRRGEFGADGRPDSPAKRGTAVAEMHLFVVSKSKAERVEFPREIFRNNDRIFVESVGHHFAEFVGMNGRLAEIYGDLLFHARAGSRGETANFVRALSRDCGPPIFGDERIERRE